MRTTTNYNLPVVEGQDKATWLTTFNDAMNDIDTALKGVADTIPEPGTDYSAQIKQLQTDVASIKSALAKLVNVVVIGAEGTGITAQQYSNLTTVSANVK